MSHTIRNTFTDIHGLRKANKSSSAWPPLYLLHVVSYLPVFNIRCLRSVHYLALPCKIWLDSNSEIANQSGFALNVPNTVIQTLTHYGWGGLPAYLFPLVLIAGFLIKLNKRSPSPSLFSQSLWRLIPRVITITRLLTMSMFDETEAVFKLNNENFTTHKRVYVCLCRIHL